MAKIKQDFIEYATAVLEPHYERIHNSVIYNELTEKSDVALLWGLYLAVRYAARQEGFSELVVGRANKVSWIDETKFVYDGEINDSHIETAMRSVLRNIMGLIQCKA